MTSATSFYKVVLKIDDMYLNIFAVGDKAFAGWIMLLQLSSLPEFF